MIWDVSVLCVLTGGSGRVFSHEIAVVDISDFELVLSLLVIPPLILSVSLLSGESLVLLLKLLHHLSSFGGHLVFQHSSHSV